MKHKQHPNKGLLNSNKCIQFNITFLFSLNMTRHKINQI